MKLQDIIEPFVEFRSGYHGARNLVFLIRQLEKRKEGTKLSVEESVVVTSYNLSFKISRYYKLGSNLYFNMNPDERYLLDLLNEKLIAKKKFRYPS